MRQKVPETYEEKLEQLQELREAAIHSASEQAVEKQHAKGKLTARERIQKLLDPGSFQEIDTFVRHRTYEFDMQKNRPWGDAVVTGHALIEGRPGAVYSPAMTDFIFMVKETSHMFITGPDVIKTVTGEEPTFEELGGAMTHNTKSGVAHFAADNEESCLEDVRYLMSFLPQNNLETAPRVDTGDDPERMDLELDTIVPDNPNKPYDMRDVGSLIVDDGEVFEVHEHF